MSEEDLAFLYRKAKAEGMREVADWFKTTNPDTAKYIRDMAERTEKGEI